MLSVLTKILISGIIKTDSPRMTINSLPFKFFIFLNMTYAKALSLLSNDSITTSDQLLAVLDYIVACFDEPVSVTEGLQEIDF